MNVNEIVKNLKQEASSNPVAKAVFLVFGVRDRARNIVTMHNLMQTMKREQFNYSRDELEGVLKFLASLGLGTLDTDRRGKVRALKDIKITLQSIGAAACGKETSLKSFRSRNKYMSLVPGNIERPVTEKPASPTPKPLPGLVTYKNINLLLSINNKEVRVALPSNLDSNELVELVGLFQKASQ